MQSMVPNPSPAISPRSRQNDVEMGDNLAADAEEAHVEHLLQVHQPVMAPQAPLPPLPIPATKALPYLPTTIAPPTLALNDVPFSFSAPIQEPCSNQFGQTAGPVTGYPARQIRRSQSRSRSPSPRRPEGEDARPEVMSNKIRIVGIADPQKDALVSTLSGQISKSNDFLQFVQKQLEEIKTDTAALRAQARDAENRSKRAEEAVQLQQLQANERFSNLEKSLKEDASQKVLLAEKRAQSMLLDIRGLRRISPAPDTRTISLNEGDSMILDQPAGNAGKQSAQHGALSPPRSQLPAPPKFPRSIPPPVHPHTKEAPRRVRSSPTATGLPDLREKPSLSRPFRPRSNGGTTPSSGMSENSSECESEDDQRSRPKLAMPNHEELVGLLLTTLGINGAKGSRRRKGHPDFKDPVKRRVKEEGKAELASWLRQQLHYLIGIKKTRDILKFSDEIYASNTELQRSMVLWETEKTGQGPKIDPMKINWNNLEGPWNMQLCKAFVQHCVEKGLGDESPPEDVKEFVADYFWGRLQRLRTTIRKNKPTDGEDPDTHNARVQGKHLETLIVARRNTRRNQLFKDRMDICLDNLPRTASEVITDEQRIWKARYDVMQALGPEGMSSDESDLDSNTKTFIVKNIPWRNRRLTEIVQNIDKSRHLTNAYGNTRPGNSPRIRVRRDRPRRSARKKAPTGKPVDMYDTDWYEKLTYQKQVAVKAIQALKY
ncbi:hypothetical protein CVT26_011747 [Gymnopilus dilepis]|uniref:Uncharacterized protein n=1 Tax=Gymnopilus dilepis TaxID=231916 RepID=A0A409YGX1_9AGAR|nr:hypothetical protein CVT26_011747 [Gymnopilus dilepis]